MKKINVYQTVEFPSQYDDLITKKGRKHKTIATIYTEEEAKRAEKDHLELGIKKSKDGIYDIIVDASEINNEVVRDALCKLEKKTHKKYKFVCRKTPEDEIIDYANHLIDYGKRFMNKRGEYDFSKAKIPYEKTLVIRSWIGELLYEVLTHKNPDALKSLDTIIGIEIGGLIKQK